MRSAKRSTDRSTTAGIPVLSLSQMRSDSLHFARRLGSAWREYGFVGVRDHGIAPDLIERAYQVAREFFALPATIKQRYHHPGTGGARGYTGFGIEQARDHDVPDLKEFWHVGRPVSEDNPYPEILQANVWPDEIDSFRPVLLELYDCLDQLGRQILAALALEIGLGRHWFDDKVDHGNSILRLIHYPPLDSSSSGAVRAARHEDINLITLLIGSDEQGLEILTRKGEWQPINSDGETIVVNVGDMLQRLTNHVYPSTTHRVINPPGRAAERSRYSMPFFLHPNPDFLIKTLPECIPPDRPDCCPHPITAHDYLLERLREIRLL